MAEKSAGILLYRSFGDAVEVLLVHPGGPFWARKDDGAWSIPKGLIDDGENAWEAARREFAEETGSPAPGGPPIDLGEVTLKSGKVVAGYALRGDLDADAVVSGTFEMIWPPRSGRTASFPEVDRAGWFGLDAAAVKLNPAQTAFLDRLREKL
ncbi:MAG: NUDIX domain-containing protein [Gordonia sp. (in: high G+C Gram-positive bacteria)]|uniref:NUDIX domain-containing protein n=1 Tax=Gordonia sp. (in: high G+C Gram-positive bacteria) TaxID=84139 RepID=UPI0039E53D32